MRIVTDAEHRRHRLAVFGFYVSALSIVSAFNLACALWLAPHTRAWTLAIGGTGFVTVALMLATRAWMIRADRRRAQVYAALAAVLNSAGPIARRPASTVAPYNPPSDATRRRWAELDRHTPSWKPRT